MKTQEFKVEDGCWPRQSVLQCGGNPAGAGAMPLLEARRAQEKLRRRLVLPEQSKGWRALTALSVLLFAANVLFAQNYAIDWFTISGGGGTSTGGGYSMSSTIGQPAAGAMSGGSYSIEGGFWSIVAAPPLLSIKFTSTNTVVVSWPSPSTDFALQQNADLNTSVWVTPSEAVTDDGTNKFLIVNPPTGHRFYRLFKP